MGQTISSSLKGCLVDQADAAVPNARVTVTNEATRAALEVASAANGSFVFPNVLAGSYTLRAEAAGFQSLEIRHIVVSAGETRALARLVLRVGEVRQSVTVTAEGTPVQLASSEKAGVITDKQIQNVLVRGRDLFALVATVPGVLDTAVGARLLRPTPLPASMLTAGARTRRT